MEFILSGGQMRACDTNSIEKFHIPSLVLMERASLGLVDTLLREGFDPGRTLILCGVGNNGGDGLAAARILSERGFHPVCVLAGDEEKCSRQTRTQLDILRELGILVDNKIPAGEYTTIIDALFGIGLSRPVEGINREMIKWVNASGARVVSADIPSGIHTDSGEVMGAAVRADLTVTFAYLKRGLILHPGAEYAGRVVCVPMGIPEAALEGTPECTVYGENERILLPVRPARSNKGTFGKVLLAAGSRDMAGAAFLAGSAVLKTGAGMLKIYTPEENRVILQERLPEALLCVEREGARIMAGGPGYEGPGQGLNANERPELMRALEWADVVGVGPGLSQSGEAQAILRRLFALLREKARQGKRIPVLIDADGLNLLAGRARELAELGQPVTVTPHPGEMARLLGCDISDVLRDIPGAAVRFAGEYGVVCVLKDVRTVIAKPDGRLHINRNGNSGMATAGSGDVLSGIILGLLAQGEEPFEAARKGVFLHGEAGDLAAEEKSQYGTTAGDLAERIPVVLLKHSTKVQ